MRLLVQRVAQASVTVDGEISGAIGPGILAFVGFTTGDDRSHVEHLAKKLVQLRIFEDEGGKMNLSVQDLGYHVLLVSQFTLYGDAAKGNRPSFVAAMEPREAEALYDYMVEYTRGLLGAERVATGIFRAMMEVELVNSGPVTLLLER